MISDSYIAGFVDGEGCISVYANGRRTSHTLVVQVVQNKTTLSTELLSQLQARFGGSLSRCPSRGTQEKYNWQVTGENAAIFLETLLPHLMLKKEQASVAVKWYRSRPPRRRDERGRIVMTSPEQQEIDLAVNQQLRRLKRAA